MSSRFVDPILTLVFVSALLLGCKGLSGDKTSNTNSTSPSSANNSTTSKANNTSVEPDEDGTIPSGTGTEKEKPAPGTGNVQGKAMFNEQPAAGVEAKLCEKFNQFFGGCSGKTYTAKTDSAGEYLIKNVPPGTYEGLTVRVFNTPYYVFATSGIITAAKYNIEADKTYFAPDSNLFKNDLKVTAPKSGAKVAPEGIEIKWDAYPDAQYYKLSVYADTSTGAEAEYDYIGRRVDETSVVVEKALKPGTYNIKLEAYNPNDIKLAQSSNDIKITVK